MTGPEQAGKALPGGHAAPDTATRLSAKAGDLLIFLVLAWWDNPIGPVIGLSYLLLADAISHGRSLGKMAAGLQVVRRRSGKPASIRHSVLRNLPVAFAGVLALIPLVGWLLFLTLGAAVLAFESYMVITDEEGARAGDVLADTRVIVSAKPVWDRIRKAISSRAIHGGAPMGADSSATAE